MDSSRPTHACLPFKTSINVLRLIDDDDGRVVLIRSIGFSPPVFGVSERLLTSFFVDGVDGHDHDLNARPVAKFSDLPKLARVVEEILERLVGVEREVVLGNLSVLIAFLDGNRRNDNDDELGETQKR